jgi:hypothetical protein
MVSLRMAGQHGINGAIPEWQNVVDLIDDGIVRAAINQQVVMLRRADEDAVALADV